MLLRNCIIMEKTKGDELQETLHELMSRTLCINEMRNFAKTRFEYYTSMSKTAKMPDTQDKKELKKAFTDIMVHMKVVFQYFDFVKYMDKCEDETLEELKALEKKIDESNLKNDMDTPIE